MYFEYWLIIKCVTLYSMDQIDMGMTSRKQNLRKTVYNIFY